MLRRIVLFVLLLGPAAARGVDLGILHWKTAAGQAAFAEIELRDSARGDAAALRASIASRDAYGVAGLTYHAGLANARLELQTAGNRQVLRIDNLPQNVRPLDLLIVVSNRLSLSLAEYRVIPQSGPQEIAPSPAGTLQVAQARAAAGAKAETPPTTTSQPAGDGALAAAGQAVQAWALAWSRRDADAYIAAYTADYPGEHAKPARQDWIEQRRTRILARKNISVELADLRLERDGEAVVATFEQRYRSDGPSGRARKRMLLVPADGRWLIKRETTLY